MPEALAILFVFFASITIGLYARGLANSVSATEQASETLQTLQAQSLWLDERLRLAKRENWDNDMIAQLQQRIRVNAQQLTAQLAATPEKSAACVAKFR